ncbi:MAG: glycoside hydrolase family 9 protein [Fimbriimonadaceae bacterium]
MRWRLSEHETLEAPGLTVTLAHDFYPEGHQSGLTLIQHGRRVAANGAAMLEPTPGQWSPVPKVGERSVDPSALELSVRMAYPDETRDRKGFNPIEYPDLRFSCMVSVRPDGEGLEVSVRPETALPQAWAGRVGFALELFPGWLFGRTFQTEDGTGGVFPRQANGAAARPLASGRALHVAPECPEHRLGILSVQGGPLELWDARVRHNNGWFVVWAALGPEGLVWRLEPHAIEGWRSEPVIQHSQVGYRLDRAMPVVVELDPADEPLPSVEVLRIGPNGPRKVAEAPAREWGGFLRYRYLQADLGPVAEPGMFLLRYGDRQSEPFRVGEDVYEGLWRTTVDTFLPVQMCHVRVEENYRVWHGACHLDDARMAPLNTIHLDGYEQGPETLCGHQPGDPVPGLDRGGWHDAGDYDLRIESQAHTVHGLALAYECFRLDEDDTTVDQQARVVRLRQPDGVPDILQQVEHGALFLLGAYRSVGRHFRGIIEPTLRQYVHLGDAATATDNFASGDDRWVFTQRSRGRELDWAAALAAAGRVLQSVRPELAHGCLDAAVELFAEGGSGSSEAALELWLALGHERYWRAAEAALQDAGREPMRWGATLARVCLMTGESAFRQRARQVLERWAADLADRRSRTPYGVPYEPRIWGAGWEVQRFGVRQYWLHRACPDLAPRESWLAALHFVLGLHPGPNRASFVSGVGARSVIPGYGVNRADESYIPGGIASGTSLIRPDLPELLEWPYLWQQTEYCLGHPTADFVFLAAAAARG